MENMQHAIESNTNESFITKQLKKLQLLAMLVGVTFATEAASAQSSVKEVLNNAKEITLSGSEAEKINTLHHSIDSLIAVLDKQLEGNKDTHPMDLGILHDISPEAHVLKYKDVRIGGDKDFSSFSMESDSAEISYGSTPENGFSVGKDLKGDNSQTTRYSVYKTKTHTITTEDPNETPDALEHDLEQITLKLQTLIGETTK